jgi:hypothetical protein
LDSDERGRFWTWPALVVGALLFLASVPTWGLSVVLMPVGALLMLPALRWSRRDGLFLVAFAVNAVNALLVLSYAVAWLTGDLGIGLE